jgi:hypothetical protein
MRHRKVAQRPNTFVSAKGKEITLGQAAKEVATDNERVQKRGKVRA